MGWLGHDLPSTPKTASSPSRRSVQWMSLDNQHRCTGKPRLTQRRQAWDRAFSRDDGVGSTQTGANQLGSRSHSGTGGFGDEAEQLKLERLSHFERSLRAPATPDRGAPASPPRSGTGTFSPEVRSSGFSFSPGLATPLPPAAAGSGPGGRQSAGVVREVVREVVRLKLYVEDAELLSEAAVRPLRPPCTRPAFDLRPLHPLQPLCTRAAPSAGCGGGRGVRRRGAHLRNRPRRGGACAARCGLGAGA